MKTNKKILAIILAVALILTLMPAMALAGDNPAIKLGAPAKGEKFRFGSVPESWRVLSSGDGKLFVIADTVGYWTQFNAASNVWAESKAQEWCEEFYKGKFSSGEKGAILSTTKSEEGNYEGTFSGIYGPASLNGEYVFFLSAEEADTYFSNDADRIANATDGQSQQWWWLRSPHAPTTLEAGVVQDDGNVYYFIVGEYYGARPAFNLNLSSVLFSSAAAGGKSSGDVGAGSLKEISTSDVSVWKLTLKDSGRSGFTADADTGAVLSQGKGYSVWTVPITYSGAGTESNEYVSAILCDSDGKAIYYGNIAQSSAEGTVDLSIPEGLDKGTYTLKVFSEQKNADNATDYASAFKEITLTVMEQELCVGGVMVDLVNGSSGEGWSYDPSSKTLTLNGATITGVSASVKLDGYTAGTANIYSNNMNLNIVLAGTKPSSVSGGQFGILIGNGNLTMSGDGTLNVQSINYNDIAVKGDIAISGTTVTSMEKGIDAFGSITIKESNVTASYLNGAGDGINVLGGCTIEDSTVNASGGRWGIFSKGDVSIRNSTVVAKGEANGAIGVSGASIVLEDVAITIPVGAAVSGEVIKKDGAKVKEVTIEPVPKYNKVSFETNGGSAVPEQTVEKGKTATKPEDPEKDGYKLFDWYEDEACTKRFDFTKAIEGDTPVYAYWVKVVNGFKLHADGTEKDSGGNYKLKTDTLELLFAKDTANVEIEVSPLSTDRDNSNLLTAEPEKDKEYWFRVEINDVDGVEEETLGRPTIWTGDEMIAGIDATAEDAVITFDEVAHSPAGKYTTIIFKYKENKPEPEPDPEPDPEPKPEPEPEPEPAPIVKPVYWVSEGTDLTVSKDTAEGLKLTVHRKPDDQLTYSLFTGVEMGGKQLSSSDFTAESGSLKLTVNPSYIKDLAEGSYKLTVKFSDGEATANVKVTEANDNPRTGDESGLWIWILIAVIAAGGIIAALLVYRKQSKRE